MWARRKTGIRWSIYGLIVAAILAALVVYLHRHSVAVMSPDGSISRQERNLMFLVLALCAVVVIPVFALTVAIALKYREGNKRPKKYQPNWDGSRKLELTWWGIPIAIITTLAIVAWFSSYRLDPFKTLASSNPSMEIQVVSLDWKWLFIYPKQNIATVNYARLPVNTPVDFHITSDSVMNSFWIPNLGGQMYSMPGMDTQLNLVANKAGNYYGSSANISGQGFAGMHFTAAATSKADFDSWVKSVKQSTYNLDFATYQNLAKPSQNTPVTYYASTAPGLFDYVVDKYMMPASQVSAPKMPAMKDGMQ